jgi:hypothetical protein
MQDPSIAAAPGDEKKAFLASKGVDPAVIAAV